MQRNLNRNAINIFCCYMAIYLLSSLPLMAQKQVRLSYYQTQLLDKANNYFESGDYLDALNNYRKIIRKTPGDTSVVLKMAECFKMLNSFEESEKWYRNILQDKSNTSSILPVHKLNYAQILTINGKYDEALYWYKEYYFSNSSDPRGMAGIRTIENLNKLYFDTMFYVAYPTDINTVYTEFSPAYYNNGIVFVSDRPKAKISDTDKGTKPGYLNWYYSGFDENGKLKDPMPFNRKKNIKTSFNEGPVIFCSNGTRMIFTQNTKVNEKTKEEVKVFPIQLYSVEKNDEEQWGEVKLLDFCNNSYSYAQPAITSDGKTLVFSSKMPDGTGGSDLYMSELINGSWQEPVNLGDRINSEGNEMFPYILNDSLLYFSSDGHGGLGGLDICYVPLFDTGGIVNIGFPVNSSGDDFGIMYEEDGMSGYFSSNRQGLKGRDDIYAFKIIRVSLILKIIDINTSQPVSDAEVFSISGMDESLLGKTDENGFCTVIIPVSKEIKIRIKKEDFESQVFTFEPMMYKTKNTVVLPINDTKNIAEKSQDGKYTKVIYKVQVMASRQKATSREIKRKYKGDLQVVMSYEDNWYKYTIGEFDTYINACLCLNNCKVYDAFIVAYINHKRVNLVMAKSVNNENEQDQCHPVRKSRLHRK